MKALFTFAKDFAEEAANKQLARKQDRSVRELIAGLAVTNPSAVQSVDARAQRIKHELACNPINLAGLKRLTFHGIPENKDHLRGLVWKLLLKYLPTDQEDWSVALARNRTQYHIFREGVVVVAVVFGQELQGEDVTREDHPLSLDHGSRWHTYFKDNEIIQQVERDVVRTHPDMHFFTGDSEESELHREEMARALFMYAKLNPGLCYIQGMNELIAPLYYLFKTDPDPMAARYAEADCFWCFVELISEFRDHFCQQLDNASSGIRATIRKLMLVLQHHDMALWKHMEVTEKVDPQFYAFRWITLLLSQEFAFPDAMRIWDTILSDPHGRMDCLLRICTAMILNIRHVLIAGDFTTILKTLQRYPPVDVNVLLQMAAAMPSCRSVLGAPV
ncbi:MAG: hypothetical protein WDW38_008487 [Sanguina aurantia]